MKNDSLRFAAGRNYHINWRWEKNNGIYPDYNAVSRTPEIYTRYFGSSRSGWVSAATVLRHQDKRYDYTAYGSERNALLAFSDYYDCFLDWGATFRIENVYLSYYLGNSFPNNVPDMEVDTPQKDKMFKLSEWYKKNFMDLEIYLVNLDVWNIHEGTADVLPRTIDLDGYTLLNKIKLFNTGMITQQNILGDLLCDGSKNLGMFQGLLFLLKNSGYGRIASPSDFVSVFLDVSVFVTGGKKISPTTYVRHINMDIPFSSFVDVAPAANLYTNASNVYFNTPMYHDYLIRGFRNKAILTNTGKYPVTLNFGGNKQQVLSDQNKGVLLKPGVTWEDKAVNSDRIFARSHYGTGRLSGMESMIGPFI
jgi:hypothetical protein